MRDVQPRLSADPGAAERADNGGAEAGGLTPLATGAALALLHAAALTFLGLLSGARQSPASIALVVILGLAAGLEGCVSVPEEGGAPRLAIASALALLVLFCLALAGPGGGGILPVVGTSMLAGGVALRIAAIRALGRHFVSAHRPGVLVRTGPYRWLRHPSESGQLLLGLGAAALMGSLAALTWWSLVVLPLTLWRLRDEEAALARLPGYAAYRARVPGLVPRVPAQG